MIVNDLFGAFVNQNYVFDVQSIYQTDVNSPEFKELLVRLYQNVNNISMVVNVKETGLYPLQETINSQLYFSNPAYNSTTSVVPALRQVYRKTFNYTTALPNTGTATIPHGITCTAQTTFTRIYATANDTTGFNYIPLPYASNTAGASIELSVDGTNIYITTGSNRTNFNITYIVLEYLQN